VIEEALETVGLMLGSDKSRGYCLEMICADFLGSQPGRDSTVDLIMQSSSNSVRLRQKQSRLKLNPKEYTIVRNRVLERDGWRCQECGSMEGLEVHHMKRKSQLGGDVMQNLITLCVSCHGKCHGRRR
jgi:5-methylcytosine-specific restriction endonuclease McrA